MSHIRRACKFCKTSRSTCPHSLKPCKHVVDNTANNLNLFQFCSIPHGKPDHSKCYVSFNPNLVVKFGDDSRTIIMIHHKDGLRAITREDGQPLASPRTWRAKGPSPKHSCVSAGSDLPQLAVHFWAEIPGAATTAYCLTGRSRGHAPATRQASSLHARWHRPGLFVPCHRASTGSPLGRRLRRRPNGEPALVRRLSRGPESIPPSINRRIIPLFLSSLEMAGWVAMRRVASPSLPDYTELSGSSRPPVRPQFPPQ